MIDYVHLVWDDIGVESAWFNSDRADKRVRELKNRGVRSYVDTIRMSDYANTHNVSTNQPGDPNLHATRG